VVRRRSPAEFSALPGVISGRRFKVVGAGKPQYAALYELSAHPDGGHGGDGNAGVKDGTVHMTDAVDPGTLSMITFEPR